MVNVPGGIQAMPLGVASGAGLVSCARGTTEGESLVNVVVSRLQETNAPRASTEVKMNRFIRGNTPQFEIRASINKHRILRSASYQNQGGGRGLAAGVAHGQFDFLHAQLIRMGPGSTMKSNRRLAGGKLEHFKLNQAHGLANARSKSFGDRLLGRPPGREARRGVGMTLAIFNLVFGKASIQKRIALPLDGRPDSCDVNQVSSDAIGNHAFCSGYSAMTSSISFTAARKPTNAARAMM